MAAKSRALYIGLRGFVASIDRATGQELWRTSVKGAEFVNVVLQDGELYAGARGELYRLDPATGAILWHNKLPGLGWGIVAIAGGGPAVLAEKKSRDDAASTAAASA